MRGTRLLRRAARIAGVAAFVLFELVAAVAAFGIAALRCCGGGQAGPQDAGEWAGLVLLAAALLLLGLAVAAGVALTTEGVRRQVERRYRRP